MDDNRRGSHTSHMKDAVTTSGSWVRWLFSIQLLNNLYMNKYLIDMQIMKGAGKQHIQF